MSRFIEARPFASLAPANLKLGDDRNLYDKRAINAEFRESDFFSTHKALKNTTQIVGGS